ncbi:MAG: sugar nucleotide-binding protein, partial [Chitinophagaceae bacterium]
INPDAQLVQTEDLGKTYSTSKLKYQADFDNERRWLTYDLLCGKVNEHHPLWNYLTGLKIPIKEFEFFLNNVCVPNIFGFNHYVTSERFLDHRVHLYPFHYNTGLREFVDVEAVRSKFDEDSGIGVLLKEAWERYKQPIAITEVHLHCHREEQLRWFKHVYNTSHDLLQKGVNIKAVTAWALLGSYGWSNLLTQANGIYEPGVFDMRGGTPRPTALAGFIKDINKKDKHPACNGEGWWERGNRYICEPSFKTIHMQNKSEQPPIIIIGKTGTLGTAFARICEARNLNYKILNRGQCDIANQQSVKSMIEQYKPWCIINTAGYVKVDDAEKEHEKCFRENKTGPQNLAVACKQAGVKLVIFSSDLVFDGKKNTPYVESDAQNPLNIYGHSKFQCEELVIKENHDALIIRTSAFFGPWDEYNFVYHVRKSLSQFETITVANDIYISPTYIVDLVHSTLDLIIDDEKQIWHLSNQGKVTWSEFALMIADRFGLDKKLIIPLPQKDILFIAKRPAYSVLSSERAILLPGLEDALYRYSDESRAIHLLSKTA